MRIRNTCLPAVLVLALAALLSTLPSLHAVEFIRGDANSSGDLDMTDALFILNWKFQSSAAPTCEDTADLNDSGDVDVTDPVLLLDFLFKGGRPPAAPFPVCGVDPTPDDLSCTPGATHGACENKLVQANFFNIDDLVDDVVDTVTGNEDNTTITARILDEAGNPLRRFRITHTVPFVATEEYMTDEEGFVTIESDGGLDGLVDLIVHAENPVVKMLDGAILNLPVNQSVTVGDGDSVRINDQSEFFSIADEMRRNYNNGLREFSPWNNAEFANGNGSNKILLSFPDLFPSALDFVEPASIPTGAPLIHLKNRPMTAAQHAHVRRHELGHALHFGKLSLATRVEFEVRYVQWLLENITEPFHCMGRRTDEVVAYVEAFGMFADFYAELPESDTKHADFFALARGILNNPNNYCEATPATGDDVEDQVFKVIFVEFAENPAVGLDYAVTRFVECESTTLQEYASCVRELEGRDSVIFEALVQAAENCGITLEAAELGLGDLLDIVDRTDIDDLIGGPITRFPGIGEEEEDDNAGSDGTIDILPNDLLPDLIDPQLPTLGITISSVEIPASATIGTQVQFSVAYNGSATAVTWDFGDGTTATGDTVTHSYQGIGTFDVKVVVSGRFARAEESSEISITFPRRRTIQPRFPF